MKNSKIIIAGGSGFIGQHLATFFGKENDVYILSRKQQTISYATIVQWNGKDAGEWCKVIDGSHLVINLAGKSVNCRYNEKNKQDIFDSRVNASKAIGAAIQQAVVPPKLWINAASATIYRHAEDHAQDEYNGEIKNDFSVQVCKLWEATFNEIRTPFTRKAALRMAITLGPGGGVMTRLLRLCKFGLAGKMGNGQQRFSWVHITDLCRMVAWLYEHDELEGVYNCCAPHPVTNKELMQYLRQATHNPLGLPATKWMLQLGAWAIGTETELLLKSRWVVPTKIQETGFQFHYPELLPALENIIANSPRRAYHLF
jgi:uncharacterized protein